MRALIPLLLLTPVVAAPVPLLPALLREGLEEGGEKVLLREAGELGLRVHARPSPWIETAPRLVFSGAAGTSLLYGTHRLTAPRAPAGWETAPPPGMPTGMSKSRVPERLKWILVCALIWFALRRPEARTPSD